jgi:membrane associated rhomboid family serine protease
MPFEPPLEPEKARIPARSRRQAMDWSLVLVSQGIETVLALNETGWELLVPVHEYEHAMAVIQLYRQENRHWPWQQRLFKGGLLFDWSSLSWVILLLFFAWLDFRYDLKSKGDLSIGAVHHGQWWRIFTAIWLHGDWGHLAGNATVGCLLLGSVLGRFGAGAGLLSSYLAGAIANALECALMGSSRHSLGASGMVMGSLGILASQSFYLWRFKPYGRRYLLTSVAAGLMLFILFGLAPETDVIAHLGGFISGLALGGLLSFSREATQKPSLNFIAGLTFIALVVIPWWKALSHTL